MRALAFVLAVSFVGCATFRSGPAVSRKSFKSASRSLSGPLFGKIYVAAYEIPAYTGSQAVAEPRVAQRRAKSFRLMDSKSAARFEKDAMAVFRQAGLYDGGKGEGTLNLSLRVLGRWNYRDVSTGLLADTPYVLILPVWLKTAYSISAEGDARSSATGAPGAGVSGSGRGGPFSLEASSRLTTVFHLAMIPLYPFLRPGRQERAVIRCMLRKLCVDIIKRYHVRSTPFKGD